MISERLFSRSYASFWRDTLPFSEPFVRGVNGRWNKVPVDETPADALERAIANEGGVRLFRRMFEDGSPCDGEQSVVSAQEAARWLKLTEYDPSEEVLDEVQQIARTLEWRYGRGNLRFSPKFKGCGLVGACEGDFLDGTTLVEVKAGLRGFRSPDFRQVIIYLALNFASKEYEIDLVNVFNARLNRLVDVSVEELCLQLAGDAAPEVLSRVLEFSVGGVVSGV